MELIPLSLIAGVLTVLAPCVLPLLPVIIGGSVTDRNPWRPVIITLSLAGSIVLFTLLLKASTIFIDIPQAFWTYFSATIILVFAFSLLFPITWAKLLHKLGLGRFEQSAQKSLYTNSKNTSLWGMIATGGALGPVFASCSPTYFFVLGTVLPENWLIGVVNLAAYAIGLSLVMFVVAFAGQRALGSLNSLSNPHGWFKRTLGILFLIVGMGIATGYDKKLEIAILDAGFFDVSVVEQKLLDKKLDDMDEKEESGNGKQETRNEAEETEIREQGSNDNDKEEEISITTEEVDDQSEENTTSTLNETPGRNEPSNQTSAINNQSSLSDDLLAAVVEKLNDGATEQITYQDDEGVTRTAVFPYRREAGELTGTGQWYNSESIDSLDDLEGKVVAVKFWTYSCINCIRTLDETQALWEKYQDDDFVLLAVHTPEFAFEKDPDAVAREIETYGLTFPVVQDNEFKTWRTFNNRYWPAFYLIDRDGVIRYTHFGEGKYEQKDHAVGALLSLE